MVDDPTKNPEEEESAGRDDAAADALPADELFRDDDADEPIAGADDGGEDSGHEAVGDEKEEGEEEAPEDKGDFDFAGLLSPEDLEELVALEAEAYREEAEAPDEPVIASDRIVSAPEAEPHAPPLEVPGTAAAPPDASPDMEALILGEDELSQMVEDTMDRQAAEAQADGDYSIEGAGELVSAYEEADALGAPVDDDAPLAGTDLDEALQEEQLDEPVLPNEDTEAEPEPEPELEPEATSEPEPEPEAPPVDAETENELSQEFLDALLSTAGSEEAQEIGSENLAAAATTPAPPDSGGKDELDELIARREMDAARQPDEAPPAKVAKAAKPPGPPLPWVKLTAAGLAGIIAASAVFYTLAMQRTELPTMESVLEGGLSDLQTAMERARILMNGAEYLRAAEVLDTALDRHPDSPLRDDAAYLQLEAMVSAIGPGVTAATVEFLHQAIDRQLNLAPRHARAPEAKYWKAQLYLIENMEYAANDLFETLVRNHSEMPGFDRVLREAAELALELRDPLRGADYAQRLLNQFPDSPEGGRARLVRARSFAMAGMERDARTLLIRIADSDADPNLRGEAIRHLGQMYYDEGDYDGAIRDVNAFLESTLTTEGNDEAYLLLARAQHAAGRGEEARSTLNDLLNFFPESEATPKAFVELSQVHEGLGERQAAVRVAQQAALRYPDDGPVLANLGQILGLSGNPVDAANALVAAEAAGVADPRLLLVAARHYRAAGQRDRALQTYDRLQRRYVTFPEAFQGSVEAARILYETDDVAQSVERLEGLLRSASRDDDRLLVTMTALDIFNDLGFTGRVAELARDLAGLTAEPEDLAEAALALLRAGAVREGRELFDRIALASLPERTAYELLTALGKGMLTVDPRRAVEHLEDAYLTYPGHRSLPDSLVLLDSYLASDRTAAASRMVANIEAAVEASPVDTAYFVEAASRWGDYLFDNGDYRLAADAYGRALEHAEALGRIAPGAFGDPQWAKFQRANALLALADFGSSLRLFEEISASDSPWAVDAALKAEQARIEQRLRGGPGRPQAAG